MDDVTAPGPHNPPSSRRAARSLRERDLERASEPTPDVDEEPAERTKPLPIIDVPPTRRAARAAEIMQPADSPARHARARRAARIGAVFGLAAAASLIVGSTVAVTAAMSGPVLSDTAGALTAPTAIDVSIAPPLPVPAASIPAPTLQAAPAAFDICAIPEVTSAIAAGDDAGAIAAAGGAEPFRAAIASGLAPCVPLDDPAHVWVIVNKIRPYTPLDYSPTPLSMPQGVQSLAGGSLRTDASDAMSVLVGAAAQAGAGEIALESGYRSYQTQQSTYGNNVSAEGAEQADLSSARPGFSEHQSGLAGDVVACNGGCGTLDELAGTAQGQWILDHAWEYGWITRYVEGSTPVSGYVAEPWHLRYIGPELARAYHEGGWRTLEEFFGLPAAPDYAD